MTSVKSDEELLIEDVERRLVTKKTSGTGTSTGGDIRIQAQRALGVGGSQTGGPITIVIGGEKIVFPQETKGGKDGA